ncbi:MAG: FHA domain-containing protein, partial [Clostridiales bacterium]|nr:FHA domain-containing protein [Clostridiales bacterium]
MRFVFGIYADDIYREVLLPKIDNTNYEIVLHAKDYNLMEDVLLSLEVVNGQWSFRSSRTYQVFCDGRVFEGQFIRPGQIFQVSTQNQERVAVLVWQSEEELAAYRKYQVESPCCVTIGRSEENDICCSAGGVMGHRHARIYFNDGAAFIQDLSSNGTYLDNHRVRFRDQKGIRQEDLHFGQHIGLYGMSIIYLGNILAVNSLDGSVSVREGHLKELQSMDPDDRTQQQVLHYSAETTVHIAPRTMPKLYDEPETIESAPTKQEKDKKPAWMSILPCYYNICPLVMAASHRHG